MSLFILADIAGCKTAQEIIAACRYTAQCLFFPHCGKMGLIACQMLYAAIDRLGQSAKLTQVSAPRMKCNDNVDGGVMFGTDAVRGRRGYKTSLSLRNGVFVRWICESPANWNFVLVYTKEMLVEFKRRRRREHASYEHYVWLRDHMPYYDPALCVTTKRMTPIPIHVSPWIQKLNLTCEQSYWLRYIQKEYEIPKTDFALESVYTPRPWRLEDPCLNMLYEKYCPEDVRASARYVEEQHGQSHLTCLEIVERYESMVENGEVVKPGMHALYKHALAKIQKFDSLYLSPEEHADDQEDEEESPEM